MATNDEQIASKWQINTNKSQANGKQMANKSQTNHKQMENK